MSERRTIKNIVTGLFVSNEDAVDAEVITDAVPTHLFISPRPESPSSSVTIQGKNGLYINPGPAGTQDVVWASAPHVWRIVFQNGAIQNISDSDESQGSRLWSQGHKTQPFIRLMPNTLGSPLPTKEIEFNISE